MRYFCSLVIWVSNAKIDELECGILLNQLGTSPECIILSHRKTRTFDRP